MKKKILTLVYILALQSPSYAVSEPQLPPLPTSEAEVIASEDKRSFWTKTLNFLGLKDEVKNKNDISPPPPEEKTKKTTNNQEKKTDNIQTINPDLTQNESIHIAKETSNSSIKPVSNDTEMTNNKKNEVVTNLPPNRQVPDIDLKLPDDIKPDEELPNKKSSDATATDKIAVNNQEPVKQDVTKETPTESADLKLPDDIKSDEELPNKKSSDTTATDKIAVSNQEPVKQDVKNQSESLETKLDIKKPGQDITLTLPNPDNKSLNDSSAKSSEPNLAKNIEIKEEKSQLPSKNLLETPKSKQEPTHQEGANNIDDINVKSYREHLKERLNKPKELPKILVKDLTQNSAQDLDQAQIKFANDESQVLLLPNDEVVLGEVTTESQLSLIDLSSYVQIFWDNYNNIKDEPARQLINNFVNNYDSNFNKQRPYSQKEVDDILVEAFKAIDKNSIYDLMNLLDIYPILQLVDHKGDTLLHKSVYKNNYSAAKFLIMKGIDISIRNNQDLTALDVAIAQKKPNIETLLRAAGAN